jgi:protein-tyrosine phosphatase
MTDGERSMVSSPTAEAAYTQLFDAVSGGGAVVFHCTAGKDRTGWGAAALLTTLGVPAQDVQADYLLSNTYRAAANAATLAQLPAAAAAIYKPLLDVRAEYLAAGFDEVQRVFGSWDAYLRDGIAVNRGQQRALEAQLLEG